MKIDILGFCGGYPWNGGATAGYLITTEQGQILLDCGSGVMRNLTKLTDITQISGVVLSHLHFDHMADVGVLNYAASGALRTGRMVRELQLFAPEEPRLFAKYIQSDSAALFPIGEHLQYELAGATITFLAVKHTIPCYAIKVIVGNKTFVYSADTEYFEPLVAFSQDADLFICEATICKGSTHTVGTGHMDAEAAGLIAKQANVGQLVLTHLPHDGDFPKMKKRASDVFGKEVKLANELQSITIG